MTMEVVDMFRNHTSKKDVAILTDESLLSSICLFKIQKAKLLRYFLAF